MVWLSTLGYMPSCLPGLCRICVSHNTLYLRIFASKERIQQKLWSPRALCFVSLQTGCRSYYSSLLFYLYLWAAEVRHAAWRPGLPRNDPGTESGGQRNSQKHLYLIHTLAPAHGAWCIQLQQERLMGVRPPPTHMAHFTEYSEGSYKWATKKHPELGMNSSDISIPGTWLGYVAWRKMLQDK